MDENKLRQAEEARLVNPQLEDQSLETPRSGLPAD